MAIIDRPNGWQKSYGWLGLALILGYVVFGFIITDQTFVNGTPNWYEAVSVFFGDSWPLALLAIWLGFRSKIMRSYKVLLITVPLAIGTYVLASTFLGLSHLDCGLHCETNPLSPQGEANLALFVGLFWLVVPAFFAGMIRQK